jgi:hypothetical protein
MSTRYHSASDAGRLPTGFERVGYDADRQVYRFRDADGHLYESAPGNTYGGLARVDPHHAAPAYFRERATSTPMIPSDHRPMTEFPSTWDPPPDHEIDELPSAQRLVARAKSVLRQRPRGATVAGTQVESEKPSTGLADGLKRAISVASRRTSGSTAKSRASSIVEEELRPR